MSKISKEKWIKILLTNNLYVKIMDTVLDHIELVPDEIQKNRCPHFYITVGDITKCRESLENLIDE